MASQTNAEIICRRGELLAELFLNDLGAKVTRSPFDAVDYLALFETREKAFRVMAVEVKASESPVPPEFPVSAELIARAAQSNIPTLLLVVDVKQNKLGCVWLDEIAQEGRRPRTGTRVRVPLQPAETQREAILGHLQGTAAVSL